MSIKWFRVEVSDHQGQIVAIEPGMLAGRDIGSDEESTIREAIRHLSGFVGTEDYVSDFAPEIEPAQPEVRRCVCSSKNLPTSLHGCPSFRASTFSDKCQFCGHSRACHGGEG